MLGFERIALDAVDWQQCQSQFSERTVFQTPAWLDFVAKTQKAEPVVARLKEGAAVCGYFAGLIVKKFGCRILGSPFPGWTTSYMGLCLAPQVLRRQALEALVGFAFRDLQCVHLEVMDRYLSLEEIVGMGFEHRMVPGFEIDLRQSEEVLFKKFSSPCRRCIRKADKSGVSIEQAHDEEFASDYYAQLQDVFAKQGLTPSYSIERVRHLIRTIEPTGMLLLLRARDAAGRCIGTGIFPAYNRLMYFWGGASWRQDQHLRPNELIQWRAMTYWKERGIERYDMGGGGEYKRKYGGAEIAVPWLRMSKHQVIADLRNVARRLVAIRQRTLGKLRTKKNTGLGHETW